MECPQKAQTFNFHILQLNFSPTTLHLGEIHQLVQIGRTLYVEFAFLILLFYPNMVYGPIL